MHEQPSTIEQKLDEARRRLLDMSRRNRLLNYRAKGKRSLRIVDAETAAVYRLLVTPQKSRLEFLAAEECGLQPLADDSSEAASAAPEKPALQKSRQPHQLATQLAAEALDRRLLHLDREAESALQEQGCNILYVALGMVAWKEAGTSGVVSHAPLVLVPVDLIRGSVTDRHHLVLWDEDVVVNPALREMCRRDFGLALPDQLDAETDLADYFAAVRQAIAKLDGWELKAETHLGLFSFAKLLMYLDLDPARWPQASISGHPLVRKLCGLDAELPECGECTPAEKLDEVPPRDTFQVLDADSSQQVAILAVKGGTSMVIEGPPGTGKSQTITNIIAECLSAGKTVLFVAEKAAALEVVKRRLDDVRLGDFVLELHSRKASKREIIEKLSRVMNADYPPAEHFDTDARELEQLRDRLNRYVRLLHLPRSRVEMSLYQAMSQFAALREAPEARVDFSRLLGGTRDELDRLRELVALVARAAGRLGDIAVHPWRGVGIHEASLPLRQTLPDSIAAMRSAIAQVERGGPAIAARLDARAPTCRGDAQQLLDLVKLIVQTSTITPEALEAAPEWAAPNQLDELLDTLRRIGSLRAGLAAHWKASAEQIDWQAVVERRKRHLATIWRWFQPSFYRDNRLIRQHSNYGFFPPRSVLVDLETLVTLAEEKRSFDVQEPLGKRLFGSLWHGLDSDCQVLADHAAAMRNICRLLAEGGTSAKALAAASTSDGKQQLKAAAQQYVAAYNGLLAQSKEFGQLLALDFARFLGQPPQQTTFAGWSGRLDECASAIDRIGEMADFNLAARNCAAAGLEKFVAWTAENRDVAPEKWPDVFYRQFLLSWISGQFSQSPEFREFQQLDHNALVERFRAADTRWLTMSQKRLAGDVAQRRPQRAATTAKSSRLGLLEAEMRRKRGLKPIRQLFSLVGDVVQALKPCLMMSPISVAQYLQAGGMQFDVVIFDEASQVEPADALGAIARGRQLVLVGDEKQLPPTNFFNTISAADEPSADESDQLETGDLESVLSQGAVVLERTTLRWHYRSKHDSLIEFSNTEFYDNALRVFPSPQFKTGQMGLSFHFIPDGVYLRGQGQYNPREAQAVAQAVIEHARALPHKSLGVGAFSVAQQVAIQDAVEQLRADAKDATLEGFFGRDAVDPFFVKNLETIQGDERDTIFLSVGYGPDKDGKVTMNFGPVNKEGGWRRLNVLVTRARERCVVFSSLTSDRMKLEPGTPRGVKALKEYLHFAQHGALPAVGGNTGEHDSPFEQNVASALRASGWKVDAQIGTAGFFIDLAVVDPRAEGRYLLGIECDGATYHRAATARDRDRLRQAVLERLGWSLHRIWSTDWFENRGPTLAALLQKVDKLATDRAAANAPPPPPPTAPAVPPAAPAPKPFPAPTTQKSSRATEPAPVRKSVDSDAAEPALLRGVVPYVRYPDRQLGDRKALLARSFHQMTDLVVDVVNIEGPIAVEELLRVVAGLFSARVTGATKDRLQDAVELAVRSGRVVRRGQFLAEPKARELPVRWRGADDAVTSPSLIPPEEVAAAAVLVAQQSFGVPPDDLAAAALRAMGFKRISPQLAELGRAAVDLAICEKRLVADASGYMIAPESED